MPVSAQEHRVRTGLFGSRKGVWLHPRILEHPYSSRYMKTSVREGLIIESVSIAMILYLIFGLLSWGFQNLVTSVSSTLSFTSMFDLSSRYMKGSKWRRHKVWLVAIAKIILVLYITFTLLPPGYSPLNIAMIMVHSATDHVSDYSSWYLNTVICRLVRKSFSRIAQNLLVFWPYLSFTFVSFIVATAGIFVRYRYGSQFSCEVDTIRVGTKAIFLESEFQKVSAGRTFLVAAAGVLLVLTVGIAVFILLMLSGDVETNPGPVTGIAPPLTVENIISAVHEVADKWEVLGHWLRVPRTKMEEIKRQYSTSTERLAHTLKYFLQMDPYASWRSIIRTLDWMEEQGTADGIRQWAESITDPTLTLDNVTSVAMKVEKEWSFGGGLGDSLVVPHPIRDKIKRQYDNRDDQIRAMSEYWINTVYNASWSTLASVLYRLEEKTALTACKKFHQPERDDSLTDTVVCDVLSGVTNWDNLGACLDVLRSNRNEIRSKHETEAQRFAALVKHYLDDHPSPSWRRVAWALHRMNGGKEKYHQLLKKIYENDYVQVSSRDQTNITENRLVKPGERVNMSCSFTVPFSDPKYQWYCGEHPVAANDAEFEGCQSPNLFIKECLSKHTGYYKCVVTGKSGRTVASKETNVGVGTYIKPEEAKLLGRMLKTVDHSKLAEVGITIEHLLNGENDLCLEELQCSLRKIPEVAQFANNLGENLQSRMTEEFMYQKAMKQDTKLSLLYLKMLALGPGQVGKSTFLRRLMGLMKWDIDTAEEESQPSCSTGQAEMRRVYIERRTITVSSDKKWRTLEDDCELEEQFAAITSLLKEQTEVVEIRDSEVEEPNYSTTEPHSEPEAAKPSDIMTDHQKPLSSEPTEKLSDDFESPSKELTLHTRTIPPKETEIDKLYKKFKQLRMNPKSTVENLNSLHIIINMADVGGQPAFLEMLPSLTIGPAMYLIFLKLLQGLKTPFPAMFRSEGDEEAKSYREYTYTSEEVIFTSLSSIACFGLPDEEIEMYVGESSKSVQKDSQSIALLLGTFADQLENESRIEEIEKQLKEQLEETDFYKAGLVEYANLQDVLFCVDNKSGGLAEVERYRELFEKLIENKFRKYEIPARWFMLSVFLKMLARNEGKSTVSVVECIEVGKKFKMEEKMVKMALRFLHKYIGIVMYFPNSEHLNDLVICNPQIVFASITELIFNIYDPNKRQLSSEKCAHFVRTGQFSPKDMPVNPRSDLLPMDTLLNLLVHLNIAAPIPSSSHDQSLPAPIPSSSHDQSLPAPIPSSSHDQSLPAPIPSSSHDQSLPAPIPSSPNYYFLPAVLQSAEDKDLTLPPRGDHEEELPEPLCIRFRTGFLPLGFFCALVANLVAAKKIDLLDSRQNQVVRKNKITFRFRGRFDITMIAWPKYCEVRVSRSPGASTDEEFGESCPAIRQTLQEMINKVVEKMGRSSFRASQALGYDLGFKCRNHSPQPDSGHEPISVIIETEDVPIEMKCIKCKTNSKLSAGMSIWYYKLKQPDKVSVNEDVFLTISATGTEPLTYHWLKDGNKLQDSDLYQGCSTSSLNIKRVDSGTYCCEVRDGCKGQTMSQEFTLTTGNAVTDSDVDCSNAYNTMVKCTVQLTEAMSREPQTLAGALHASGLISLTTLDKTNELNEIKSAKGSRLYRTILVRVKAFPEAYAKFIEILRKDKVLYGDILEELEKSSSSDSDEPFSNSAWCRFCALV